MLDVQKKAHANLMRIEIVETLLKLGGKADRKTLCKALVMPWTSAFDYLDYLRRKGVVFCTDKKLLTTDYEDKLRFKKGHPITTWELNMDSPYVVSIANSSSVKIADLLES